VWRFSPIRRGAIFCVWEPLDLEGAAVVNEPGAWSLSALNTNDPEGSTAFYGAVFGWTSEKMGMEGAEMFLWRVPGYVGGEPGQPVPRDVIGAMLPLRAEDMPPHWSVDFWVGDADATAERAAELGGNVLAAPYDIPVPGVEMREAVLADPQGAVFSVTKVGPPA
jgi:predicted enzyme related to lactoylglutathione lyase